MRGRIRWLYLLLWKYVTNGKFKGQFNLKSIKVYKEANDMI